MLPAGNEKIIPAALARWRLAKQSSALSRPIQQAEGLRDHVVLGGFGRLGSGIGSAFETFGIRYSVIEIDPDAVGTLRARGIQFVFGDCSHSNVLENAGVRHASLLIVTVPDRDRAWLAITNARRISAALPIIARADRREDYEFLMSAGATEVIQPETEASATIIRHACGHHLMVPDWQIRAYLKSFRDAMDSVQRKPATTPQLVPEVRKVTVSNSALAGRSLRDMKLRETFGVTSRRTREMAVRMALGARAPRIMAMVVKEAMVLASVGIVLGAGATLALIRVASSRMFGLAEADAPIFALASSLLLALSFASAAWPALRASRTSPVQVLRQE